MITEAIASKSLISAINLCIDTRLQSYHFITFGSVVKVNSNITVDVKPLGDVRVSNLFSTAKFEELPILHQVPYLMLNSPKIGDYCVLLHLDRPASKGSKTLVGSVLKYVKGASKPHSLNNCVAICGFGNYAEISPAETLSAPSSVNSSNFYQIANKLYPVGSIYLTTDPSFDIINELGGEWEQVQLQDGELLGNALSSSLPPINEYTVVGEATGSVVSRLSIYKVYMWKRTKLWEP